MSLKKCPECGNSVSNSAKECPHCGKDLKAVEKTVEMVLQIILYGACAIWLSSAILGEDTSELSSSSSAQEDIIYEEVNIDEMMDLLRDNSARANQMYKGKYIEVVGKFSDVDVDGKYFRIEGWKFYRIIGNSIRCSIKTEEQKATIIDKNIGDWIKVKGRVRDVGEFMGYSLDVMDLIEVGENGTPTLEELLYEE